MYYVEMILDAIFPGIWNMSVTAGYCILAVLLFRLLFHKIPRKYLYVLWLAVAFRLICPVSVNTGFSLFNLQLPVGMVSVSAKDSGGYGAAASASLSENRRPEDAWDRSASGTGSGISSVFEAVHGRRVRAWILGAGKYVWVSGMMVFFLYFAVSIGRVRHQVRRAVRLKPKDGICGKKGILKPGFLKASCHRKDDRMYECDDLSSPFVMGVFRPRIYIPCGLSEEQKQLVLLHEQFHIRRKDHLVKCLAFALRSVYWFHPLVWAAWFGVCRDMEMSCDEKVLELLDSEGRREYSRTLLALASGRQILSPLPLAFGEQNVKKRIRHALEFRKPAVWTAAAVTAAVALALVFLGTNGAEGEGGADPVPEEQQQSLAEKLYEARNPYVGDVSANGRLLGVIGEALPDTLIAKAPYKTELQTSKEPYEFCFRFIKEAPETGLMKELEDMDMTETAVLMLALTDNLGAVRWSYESPEGEVFSGGGSMDAEAAAQWCNSEDIKEFGVSADQIQLLLDRFGEF